MFTRYADRIIGKNPKNRLISVDIFRGLAITAMILVNNPGSWNHVYAPLLHAKWHGWTPTDLIFPFFLFIVGISMTLSLDKQLQAKIPLSRLVKAAAIRSLKLIGLGLFLAVFFYKFHDPAFNWWQDRIIGIRLPGVLQRIGLVYFATVIIFLTFGTRGRLITLVTLLLGYGMIMTYLPYTDTAGTIFKNQWTFGNSYSAYLDHILLGARHVYYPNAAPFAFDPEGLLSTLPAISTTLSGVLVGQFLRRDASPHKKALLLLVLGGAIAVIGQLSHHIIPINKSLWTPSYVVLTSGLAMMFLGGIIYLADGIGWKRWGAPFIVFGANAIAFFMLSGIAARVLIMIRVGDTSLKDTLYSGLFQPVLGNNNGSLAFALVFLLFSYAIMHWMYRRGYFWKV